jgi:hypothetical protein
MGLLSTGRRVNFSINSVNWSHGIYSPCDEEALRKKGVTLLILMAVWSNPVLGRLFFQTWKNGRSARFVKLRSITLFLPQCGWLGVYRSQGYLIKYALCLRLEGGLGLQGLVQLRRTALMGQKLNGGC